MIPKEQIKHIAKLAKLDLDENQEADLTKDLDSILDYVQKTKEADIADVKATTHSIDLKNIFREDSVEVCEPSIVEIIKEDFPQKKGEYLKVKSVFNNGD